MVESGMVSQKNQVNIMMKNIVDVTIGGTGFWLYGFALAYGRGLYSNWFCGLGDFLTDQPIPALVDILHMNWRWCIVLPAR